MAINDYQVGYKKPPKGSQFRKGVSGNPKGRRKGSRNLAAVLAHALQQRVTINENGQRKIVSKLDAAAIQLADMAAAGDLAALRQLIALASSIEEQSADPPQKQTDELDIRIMRNVLRRLEGCVKEDEDEDK